MKLRNDSNNYIFIKYLQVIFLLLLKQDVNAFIMNPISFKREASCDFFNRALQSNQAATKVGKCGGSQINMIISDKTLVSVEECIQIHERINDEINSDGKAVFIDASWWHKGDLDGRKMFEDGPRVEGAFYFDLDDVSSQYELFPSLNPKNLPHMIPPMDLFAAFMDEYNITANDHIIIYGRESVLFTPRVWFTFKTFGHPQSKLHLMQGSLDDWIEKGGKVDEKAIVVPKAKELLEKYKHVDGKSSYTFKYIASDLTNYIYSMKDVKQNLESDNENIIIDSRGSSFVKGNIPGSYHIPYTKFQTNKSTVIKNVEELQKVFRDVGVDPNSKKAIICSCGTGVSACTTFLALELCGRNVDNQPTFVYDGSWSEWGNDTSTPKERQ